MSTSPTPFQKWTITEPFLHTKCLLGEGPHYEPATNTIRFVDIKKKHLHTLSLSHSAPSPSSALHTQSFSEPISVTADIAGVDPQDRILVALKYGIAVLDRRAGDVKYLARFSAATDGSGGGEGAGAGDNERLRSNDGAVDPHGRFWLGTMTDFPNGEVKNEGFLTRFDPQPQTTPKPSIILSNLSIPNGLGWSPDGKTMYFTHSSARLITAWDYSPLDGSLSRERVFYKHDGPGEPDGFRIDKDGNLWHAVYGEGRVLKISPEGKVVGQIDVPTKNVTCTEFVGTELFITTAADEDGEGDSKKFGGALFRVDVGTTGLPANAFKLGA